MDDKRFFSRVGFSYFMMVVLTVAVQFLLSLLVSLIAPQAAGGFRLQAGCWLWYRCIWWQSRYVQR